MVKRAPVSSYTLGELGSGSVVVWGDGGVVEDQCFPWLACSSGNLDPVVQSIVSLTSSLRGQLVKCFTTL